MCMVFLVAVLVRQVPYRYIIQQHGNIAFIVQGFQLINFMQVQGWRLGTGS